MEDSGSLTPHDGKSSSPKTISSSESPLSSGKRPLDRRKLLASRIMGSRIFNGKMFLSPSAWTLPEHIVGEVLVILPPKRPSTFLSHSSQDRSPNFASGT